MTTEQRDWEPILARAAELAEKKAMTLQGLYRALIAEGLIRDCRSDYVWLSVRTAKLRRAGEFPALTHAGMVREVAA